MALGTFIAGRYSGTFDSVDVGVTRDGYELEQVAHAEEINRTDKFGDTLVDTVVRGASYRMRFVSIEYKAGSLAAFTPAGTTPGVIATTLLPIGRLGTAAGKAMVLTSTPNTPAASAPATLTAPTAALAPGFNGRLLYNSKLREVPVELVLLPAEAAGTVSAWTQT